MLRHLIFSCAFFLAASGARAAEPSLAISAPSAILIDAQTRTILFEKSADAPQTPASTAKVMTAELVFRELAAGRLRLDDVFEISENAWRTGGARARGSSMFAAPHSRVRVEDLIRGLVIDSGNDAAIALAEGLAGGEGAFATRMTKRALELNLPHLTFANSWGKADPEQRVTARDMAMLALHVIATYPVYYKYFGEKEFIWNAIRQLNRNPLLTMELGADGLKTGNIDDSGFGLVGSAVQNGQRLVLALYGEKTAKDRADEARKILQWGFRSFDAKTMFEKDEIVGYARVFGGAQAETPLVAAEPVRILVQRSATERFTGRIVYQGPLAPPVLAGAPVARLKLFRGAAEVLDVPLLAKETVEPGSLPRRAFDAGLELAGGFIRKQFNRN